MTDASTIGGARGAGRGGGGAAGRIASLDVLRGAVMVLMAVDHVRVFSGVPAGGPTPAIFFTRWITHFCAPVFVFLAGTSVFLHGRREAGRGALARYLLLRGAWLVLLEMTFLRLAWTFNLDYAHYMLAGVIWVIGWCLILMAGLVALPVEVVGMLGIAVIAGHNLLGLVMRLPNPWEAPPPGGAGPSWLFQILYLGGPIDVPGSRLLVLYVIVPWIGVMAAGYAFGAILLLDAERRDRICRRLGAAMIGVFVILRSLNLYGDPRPWGAGGMSAAAGGASAILSWLNTTKYPASLLFLLMTLGPSIAILPRLGKARGAIARWLSVYGKAPLLYYLLHIPLIHAAACLVSLAREGAVDPWLFANHPMGNPPPPDGYTWSLPLVYLVTASVVALLYVPCRWFAERRSARREAWMRLL